MHFFQQKKVYHDSCITTRDDAKSDSKFWSSYISDFDLLEIQLSLIVALTGAKEIENF